jgi:hypothetical protein
MGNQAHTSEVSHACNNHSCGAVSRCHSFRWPQSRPSVLYCTVRPFHDLAPLPRFRPLGTYNSPTTARRAGLSGEVLTRRGTSPAFRRELAGRRVPAVAFARFRISSRVPRRRRSRARTRGAMMMMMLMMKVESERGPARVGSSSHAPSEDYSIGICIGIGICIWGTGEGRIVPNYTAPHRGRKEQASRTDGRRHLLQPSTTERARSCLDRARLELKRARPVAGERRRGVDAESGDERRLFLSGGRTSPDQGNQREAVVGRSPLCRVSH